MKKQALLLFIFWSGLVAAQQNYIREQDNRNGIAFATVLFYLDHKLVNGTYCDAGGQYTHPEHFDTIVISCVGYKTLTVEGSTAPDEIVLEKQFYDLEQVTISSKRYEAGYIHKDRMQYVGLSNGSEIGSYIKNTTAKKGRISSVKFKVGKMEKDTEYRIHFYAYEENEFVPMAERSKKNTIHILKKGTKGLVEVTIEDEDIDFPLEGIYVTLECLSGEEIGSYKYYQRKKNAEFSIEAHQSSAFHFVSTNKINGVGWVNMNKWIPENYKATFGTDYEPSILFVPSIGLEVVETE
ncbi:hypothetical protein [Flavobacterium sp.]|uniref:hypothetical protein n=1 Tax=Flavobacterium sp. TaxID=239 RepID=UPI002613171A|nr:hypothetical protein [Flavobacterium sp.]